MKRTNILYLLPLLALSGCALSEELSPPPDGKTVKIVVVKPADIDILPMDVIYRSEKCRDKIFTSTGAVSSRAGYHLLTVPFKSEMGSGTVSNRVALDGGGQCEWKLSNIRFQFKFSDMTKFGAGIKKNIPNDIVFVFDNNSPPRGNGHYEDVYGDIKIKNDYYPLVIYDRIIDHAKTLSIESERMLTYKVHDGRSIFFEPHVYSDKLVKILGPEKIGDNTLSIYPDGTQTIKKKGSYPLDFKKLNEIK
ncbi:hypothetical protein ACF2G4_08940 [Pantoea sp. C3]|uniref:hypothetical protein n=1 Tax=Pantoea phytostimulans TaxID=2769024 RepID=UPI0038F78261